MYKVITVSMLKSHSIYNNEMMSGYTKTVIKANGDIDYYRSDNIKSY